MAKVNAYQIASDIDLKRTKALLSFDLQFQDSDELFYRVEKGTYMYVFEYGMVSFFNLSEQRIGELIEMLRPATTNFFTEKLEEEFAVQTDTGEMKVEFNRVLLPSADPEMIRLVMLNTSQSVALNRYDHITEALLMATQEHTQYLELKGKLNMSGQKLKRFIGKVLNIKNGILENLYIFDSPDITWERQDLNQLNNSLKQSFDLKDRYRRIALRTEIIKENLSLFKDIMDHRESSRLEWIIIILILIEVVDMFILKFIR
jgi:uncharacterized Rmd1/YagE family protein